MIGGIEWLYYYIFRRILEYQIIAVEKPKTLLFLMKNICKTSFKTNNLLQFYGIIVKYEKGVLKVEIKITEEYITLTQLLKMTDYIQTGGQAKFALTELSIQVNEEAESRRGRKLYPQDVVVIDGKQFIIK